MEPPSRQRIEEIFVIKTGAIDFFGAILKGKHGRSAVNGRVCFRDGTRWQFQSQGEDHASLRQRLVSLSETISAFYRTDTFRLRFREPIRQEEFIRLIRDAKRRMGYA